MSFQSSIPRALVAIFLSLVFSGASLGMEPGKYFGVLESAEMPMYCGEVTVQVGKGGTFSASVKTSEKTMRIRGRLDEGGEWAQVITEKNGAGEVICAMGPGTSPGEWIFGMADSVRERVAALVPVAPAKAPGLLVLGGQYTLLIDELPDADHARQAGFAVIKVGKGMLRWVGRMPDTTPMVFSVPVLADGGISFAQSGLALGDVVGFGSLGTSNLGDVILGELAWRVPPLSGVQVRTLSGARRVSDPVDGFPGYSKGVPYNLDVQVNRQPSMNNPFQPLNFILVSRGGPFRELLLASGTKSSKITINPRTGFFRGKYAAAEPNGVSGTYEGVVFDPAKSGVGISLPYRGSEPVFLTPKPYTGPPWSMLSSNKSGSRGSVGSAGAVFLLGGGVGSYPGSGTFTLGTFPLDTGSSFNIPFAVVSEGLSLNVLAPPNGTGETIWINLAALDGLILSGSTLQIRNPSGDAGFVLESSAGTLELPLSQHIDLVLPPGFHPVISGNKIDVGNSTWTLQEDASGGFVTITLSPPGAAE